MYLLFMVLCDFIKGGDINRNKLVHVFKIIILLFSFKNSNSGTYINWFKILSGKSNFTVLNNGDLISFGTEKKMTFIFKFIFNNKLSNTGKKFR